MIKFSNKKVIDVSDWDKLVEETYGRIYSFQQQNGCKERGTFEISVPEENWEDEFGDCESIPEEVNGEEMGVKFDVWLARDPKQPIQGHDKLDYNTDLWWERNFYPDVQMVANDLHKKDLIEAGEYTIDIDW